MSRYNSEEADKIIDKEFKVLDHGHVILIDYMGTDQRIVDSARVSYKGQKTKRSDKGLINYLMKNQHWSPFEQIKLTFIIKCPIFVARQIFRHRAFAYNEISGRYSVLPDEYYVPSIDRIKAQSKKNKQGSDETGLLDDVTKKQFRDCIEGEQKGIRNNYDYFVNIGIAKELARINLPLAQYTEFYCTGDLRNLFNFLRLRLDDHAQYEIAVYGQVMAEMIRKVVPYAYEAFEEHALNTMTLSDKEVKYLKGVMDQDYNILDIDGQDKETVKVIKSLQEKFNQ